ncbi:efflux RND transporter periplasmic adaptor subunit [Taylorella asinigenitalis]|uniref:efflux RND transporter periplasmic adaptor subunit n=1 Tax=Taylorella asinigenitalis TaxID=84590 RepID=UPI0004903DB4|nr:efflux RND transporter periplasmic adaptor subunit [Taylorella asinigenitalis]
MIRRFLLLVFFCTLSLNSYSQDKKRPQVATKVSVETVIKTELNLIVDSLGTAVPSETVIVRPQISGPVTRIFFKDGAQVEAGEPLYEIDPSSLTAKLNQIRSQAVISESKLLTAQQDLKRYKTLFKQDSIARQQVEKQQALVNQLKAEQIGLKAQVDQAQINLDYSIVKAPISGRLGISTIDVGNIATTNSQEGLVSIIQTNPMEVEFSLSDKFISKVAPKFYKGEKLKVTLIDSTSKESYAEGELVSLDNQIDTKTGTIKLKASFDNSEYILFPNQFVNVNLYVENFKDALALKSESVQYGKDGPFVFRVKADSTVEMVPIKLGIVDKGLTQIVSGLEENDKVVLEGVDRLKPGSKVEIIE